jgi:hypothetical protein
MPGMKSPGEFQPCAALVVVCSTDKWFITECCIKKRLLYEQGWGSLPRFASNYPVILIYCLQPIRHTLWNALHYCPHFLCLLTILSQRLSIGTVIE